MFIPPDIYNNILGVLPIACVDVLIIHNEKCLLLLRDNEPAKGMYWFPGGRILKNELIENAALRKAKEETNLDCSFDKIISVEETIFPKTADAGRAVHTINVCCELSCSSIAGFSIDNLHKQAMWINKIDSSYHTAVKNPLRLAGFHE